MVVEHLQRPSGPNGVPVQIREHLLGALDPRVDEQDHRDRLVAQLRTITKCLLNRRAAMLTVIDDEAGLQRNAKHPEMLLIALSEGLKGHLAVDGSREGGEDVPVGVVYDVPRDLGNASPIQRALSTQRRGEFLLVKDEDLGDQT